MCATIGFPLFAKRDDKVRYETARRSRICVVADRSGASRSLGWRILTWGISKSSGSLQRRTLNPSLLMPNSPPLPRCWGHLGGSPQQQGEDAAR